MQPEAPPAQAPPTPAGRSSRGTLGVDEPASLDHRHVSNDRRFARSRVSAHCSRDRLAGPHQVSRASLELPHRAATGCNAVRARSGPGCGFGHCRPASRDGGLSASPGSPTPGGAAASGRGRFAPAVGLARGPSSRRAAGMLDKHIETPGDHSRGIGCVVASHPATNDSSASPDGAAIRPEQADVAGRVVLWFRTASSRMQRSLDRALFAPVEGNRK